MTEEGEVESEVEDDHAEDGEGPRDVEGEEAGAGHGRRVARICGGRKADVSTVDRVCLSLKINRLVAYVRDFTTFLRGARRCVRGRFL